MKIHQTRMFLLAIITFCSCGKEFLNIKEDAKLVVPATIQDYQALLDNLSVINSKSSHELNTIGADDYYVADGMLETLTENYLKNAYTWADEVYAENEETADWNNAYQGILYANMALEVEKIRTSNDQELTEKNHVIGGALFIRAFRFYQLAQLFCKPYNSNTAHSDPGIPLRLEYDVTDHVTRKTVADAYQQITSDLEKAAELLPNTASNVYRPGKAAVFALLARASLQMADYSQALTYADKALSINSQLLDFNLVDLSGMFPFRILQENNPEILFSCSRPDNALFSLSRFNVLPSLVEKYGPDDLRKNAYFFEYNGHTYFGGGLSGGSVSGGWTGLAVDEVYLIRAECYARLGDIENAVGDINRLLKYRYVTDKFLPFSMDNPKDVLSKILEERRKELAFRGLRWEDLRRLNTAPEFATTLIRTIEGKQYELSPNDPRWVWPIPQKELELNGYQQNVR